MLRHFPAVDIKVTHKQRDYYIITFAFAAVALCFLIDSVASIELQYALGIAGWASLITILIGECKYVRAQVFVAVSFATIGENFASIYMSGYTYRLENLPWFVPPGHGLVYLTAIVLGRCDLFLKHSRKIAAVVVIVGSTWSILALTSVIGRSDQIGTILFVIYLLSLPYIGYYLVMSYPIISIFLASLWIQSDLKMATLANCSGDGIERQILNTRNSLTASRERKFSRRIAKGFFMTSQIIMIVFPLILLDSTNRSLGRSLSFPIIALGFIGIIASYWILSLKRKS